MRIQHLVLIAFFLTVSQINLIGKKQQSTLLVQTLTDIKEIKSVTITDPMLIEQRVLHDFSQIGKKDEFCICIRGKSFIEGNVIFTIKNFEGAEIYRIEFPSIQLISRSLLSIKYLYVNKISP